MCPLVEGQQAPILEVQILGYLGHGSCGATSKGSNLRLTQYLPRETEIEASVSARDGRVYLQAGVSAIVSALGNVTHVTVLFVDSASRGSADK